MRNPEATAAMQRAGFHAAADCIETFREQNDLAKAPIKPITLKELAAMLELSQSTVSRIINGEATAHRIAEETQQRVLHAAALNGYVANTMARGLRQKRTYTIGVIVPEISEGYSTTVISGIEDELLKDGFFYFVVSHRHRADLLEGYPRMMLARSVEGIIAVDSPMNEDMPVPRGFDFRSRSPRRRHQHRTRSRSGRASRAAHLKSLGHQQIAFIKGQAFSSDTMLRWQAIVQAARDLDLQIDDRLVVQLQSPEPGPAPGQEVTRATAADEAAVHRDLRIQRRHCDRCHLGASRSRSARSQRYLRARLRRHHVCIDAPSAVDHHSSAAAQHGPGSGQHPALPHPQRNSASPTRSDHGLSEAGRAQIHGPPRSARRC